METRQLLTMPNGAERSQALFERLCRTMPGANTRTATFYAPFPLAIERGEGPWIWDVDGNRLIDLVNNYTSLVHGHAAPPIVEAITAAARNGTVFPAPVLGQLELSERICARLDSVEQVRFTNSGTEATMHAVRCARAATGRPLLVKARHGYHGSWDGAPPVEDDVRGVPDPVRETVVWVDFNEVASLEATMAAHGDQVAAILLEPMLGGGVVPGERPFFVAARELADRHGALLILDEVVTLRLHLRGYQDALGVRPDLTTLGKVIGGGLPIGGFAAPEALMSHYDPRVRDGISHHGTFNGNTLAMAAGVASLDLLDEAAIARINGLGARLAAGL
ncbi:MAG: glutamate-semialdehyde -aminomutase, partial [Solirubrobacterales bacterium]|nr:glutamate-semialdehyde -aminomutase [Solirubrobacterales bacterium]